jgi:hypothetical protein
MDFVDGGMAFLDGGMAFSDGGIAILDRGMPSPALLLLIYHCKFETF